MRADIKGLNSLRSELDQSLDRVRQALDTYIEEEAGPYALESCLEELHQVSGSLRVLRLHAAALLIDDMQQALQAMLDETVEPDEAVFEVLFGVGLHLADYLNYLPQAQVETDLVLLPVINELRVAVQRPVLGEDELFLHVLRDDSALLADNQRSASGQDIKQLAKRCLPQFQAALLGVIKQAEGPHLARMSSLATDLSQAAKGADVQQLWWLTSAVFEALNDGGLVAGIELKRLLGRLNLSLRNLADHGDFAIGTDERELIHGLLYQLGRCEAAGAQVIAVQKAYALEQLLPSVAALEQMREKMRGPDTVLLAAVSGEIRKDLSEVRDNLDLLMRSGELSEEHSQQTSAALHRVGAAMGMLGLEDLQRVVQRQVKVIDDAQARPDPDSAEWQGVATALLWIDHSLEHVLIQRHQGDAASVVAVTQEAESVSPQELHAGSRSILREALVNLSRIREQVEAYANSGDESRIADAPVLLHEIGAGLTMLGHTQVAAVIERLSATLASERRTDLTSNPQALNRVADVIADGESLISSLLEDNSDKEALLTELQGYADALDSGVDMDNPVPPVAADAEQDSASAEPLSVADGMQEVFLEELEEIQSDLAVQLPLWVANHDDVAALAEVRRRFHTLKGSGRMVGATDIGEFGWAVESLLNRCLEADQPITQEIVQLVENAVGQLPLLAQSFAEAAPLPESARQVLVQAHGLNGSEAPAEFLAPLDEGSSSAETPLEDASDEAVPEDVSSDEVEALLSDEVADEEDIHQVFLADALSQLEQVADFFAQAGPDLNPLPVSNELLRAFHTLKSGAALAELPAMSALAAELEALCDVCQQHGTLMSSEALHVVREAAAGLLQTLEADQADAELPELDGLIQDVIDLREALGLPVDDEAVAAAQAAMVSFTDDAYALIEQVEARLAALELAEDADQRDRLLAALQALGDLAQSASVETIALLADQMRAQVQSAQTLSNEQRAALADVALGIFGLLDELRQGRQDLEADDLHQRLGAVASPESSDEQRVDEALATEQLAEVLSVEVESPEEVEDAPETVLEQIETLPAVEATEESSDQLVDEAPAEAAAEPPAMVSEGAADIADDENAEMLQLFLEEGEELLEGIDQAMDAWQQAPQDAAPAAEVLRLLHTIKGGARMAGADAVGDSSHALESLIEAHQRSGDLADKTVLAGLRNHVDEIHGLLGAFRKPEPAPAVVEDVTPSEPSPVAATVDSSTPTTWAESLYWQPEVDADAANAAQSETARVSVDLLDNMLNEAGEISIYRGRLEQQHADLSAQLVEFEQAVERLRGLIRELDLQTDAQVHAGRSSSAKDASTDRYDAHFDPLEMDRYTRLNELSRSLSEGTADLSSLHGLMEETSRDAETLLLQQGRVATSLQHGLMDTLLVPFNRQVQRLQRVVRQVGQTHDRKARIEFEGEESELDRNVLERMTGPLEHLIRNALVHGIEPAKERQKAKKPEEGVIQVVLKRDGAQSILEVSDDGRGLDTKAIRKKAEAQGLINSKAKVDDDVLWQFIFEPGFSTADSLTQEAGRGVGMDVVNAEIKQLGGTISVSSKPKQGTLFSIRIPSSLAISNALLVEVNTEQFAIPMASIEGVERIEPEALSKEIGPDGETKKSAKGIQYGGNTYGVVRLADYVASQSEEEGAAKARSVVLIRAGDNRLALVVDKVLGGQELVVKSLGPQVSAVAGIKGGAILADGHVILILDIQALHQARRRRGLVAKQTSGTAVEKVKDQRPMVMVVDDSITIRRVTEKFLLRHGFRVCTAKDGMDALPKLQIESPDLVLLDIEMPRIDGFEFATYMRNSEHFVDIPIIMITSRSGDKHQQRAAKIGVQDYMIKPYQEDALLKSIHHVMDAAKQTSPKDGDA